MNKLKELRIEKGLTIRELAAKAGIAWTTVHAVETGKRKAEVLTIRKLAKVLEVDWRTLLDLTNETPEIPNLEAA